jgi:hypothetical protein
VTLQPTLHGFNSDSTTVPAYCCSKTMSESIQVLAWTTNRSPWRRVNFSVRDSEGRRVLSYGSFFNSFLVYTTLTLPGGVAEKDHVGTTCVPTTVCRFFHAINASTTVLPNIWPFQFFFLDATSIRVGEAKPRIRVARSFHCLGLGLGSRWVLRRCLWRRSNDRHIDHRRR